MASSVGRYEFVGSLGRGSFGVVKKAIHSETKQVVAIKILDVNMITASSMSSHVKREISNMKKLNHPNIIKLYEVLKSKNNIYIVCELALGDLFDSIEEQEMFSEIKSRKVFTEILDGLDYCHSLGICHRDLKPENILLGENDVVKIADFGFSKAFVDDGIALTMQTRCGSVNYIAPEVLSDARGYNGSKSDIWSMGVILYVMLVGYLPFDQPSIDALYRAICTASFEYPAHVKPLAKDLINGILRTDPMQRMTIAEIRKHPWMTADLSNARLKRKMSTMSCVAMRPNVIDRMERIDTFEVL